MASPCASPFPTVAHPAQSAQLAPLEGFLTAHPELYGTLRYAHGDNEPAGASHVAFAWTYTTQYTVSEMFAARDGLYGRGPFPQLAQITPRILTSRLNVGAACSAEQMARPFVLGPDALRRAARRAVSTRRSRPGPPHGADRFVPRRGIRGDGHVPRAVSVVVDTHDPDPHAHWQLNMRTHEVNHVGDAQIPYLLVVPKPRAIVPAVSQRRCGCTGTARASPKCWSPRVCSRRTASPTISFDGPVHGLPNIPELSAAIVILRGQCLLGVTNTLLGRTTLTRSQWRRRGSIRPVTSGARTSFIRATTCGSTRSRRRS